ncbi:transposase [Burkholderia cenocepacia]|uniref:transposase n=1 Tax=Burkholderia cenocepacia TaxID=95486 RepID=UPI0038B7914A
MIRTLLHDEIWAQIESVLPGRVGDPGRKATDNRWFVEAVLWIGRTGRPWSDLPKEFGRWQTVYLRYWRWRHSGVWERVAHAVSDDTEAKRVLMELFILRASQRSVVRVTD